MGKNGSNFELTMKGVGINANKLKLGKIFPQVVLCAMEGKAISF